MTELIAVAGYLLLGIAVGFLAGAFGIGGGAVMVPAFYFLFTLHNFSQDVIPKFAIGTSLFAAVLASSTGAFFHLKNKNINIKIGVLIGSFAVISAFFLSFVAVKLDAATLKGIFAFVLLIVTIRLLTDQNKDEVSNEKPLGFLLFSSPFVGIIIGSLSAFAGVGGGIIAVPILHYFYKLRFKESIGTSNLIIIFSSLAAAVSYIYSGINYAQSYSYTLGYIYLLAAIPTGIGTMMSARWGANFTHKTNIKLLKILFAVLIILMDIKIIIDVFG